MTRHVTSMTIHDAEHYTAAQIEAIVASYPPHERDARTKGIPQLGSGRIFPIAEELITCEPFLIPKHFAQIIGIDFGYDHPFAAARLAWDRDDDVIYVTHCYRMSAAKYYGETGIAATPAIHATTLRGWGDWIPIAFPHDGLQHDKGSGEQLAAIYRAHGINLLPERSTFDDGTNGVEAGLMTMLERMQAGKLKVFSNCSDWFQEFRLYHRKDGKIVKLQDDTLCATRYAIMMLRHAIVSPTQTRKVNTLNPRAIYGF